MLIWTITDDGLNESTMRVSETCCLIKLTRAQENYGDFASLKLEFWIIAHKRIRESWGHTRISPRVKVGFRTITTR